MCPLHVNLLAWPPQESHMEANMNVPANKTEVTSSFMTHPETRHSHFHHSLPVQAAVSLPRIKGRGQRPYLYIGKLLKSFGVTLVNKPHTAHKILRYLTLGCFSHLISYHSSP